MYERTFAKFLKSFWPLYLAVGYRIFTSIKNDETSISQLFAILAIALVGNYLVYLVWKRFPSKNKIATPELVETSGNFDLSNVKPLLDRVAKLIPKGFGEQEASNLFAQIQKMKVEDEKEWNFNVQFAGKSTPLRISAFMDDVESPDIGFHSGSELTQQIDSEIASFNKELGI